MEQFPKLTPKKENLKVSNQEKGIGEVFRMFPEIKDIGSKEEYQEYLNSFFPESVVKDIVWHAGGKGRFRSLKLKKMKGIKNQIYGQRTVFTLLVVCHMQKSIYLAWVMEILLSL